MAAQIEAFTRVAWQTARDENLVIEVRWLMKVPSNAMIIGDPDTRHAWAYLELLQRGINDEVRPALWLTRAQFETLYGWLCVAFNKEWETGSVDPLWKPSHDVTAQQILFNLNVRRTIPMVAVRLTVTTPEGKTFSREDSSLPREFREDTQVWFGYPQQFAGAVAATSGRYRVRWEIKETTTWRDAITETYEICP